jgi:hypothetical protein
MNKWLNRAVVGTVGGFSVAGGMLLLGTGAAHADSVVPTTGTLDNVFRPAPADNLGLSVDTPGSTVSSGMVDEGPLSVQKNDGLTGAVLHTPGENGQSRDVFATGRLPDPLSALPSNDLMPGSALGAPQPAADQDATEGRHRAGAPGLPVLGTLSSLPLPGNLPVVSNATKAVPSLGAPSVAAPGQTEALPVVGGIPQLVDGNLPVLTGQGLPPVPGLPTRGNVKPVNDMTIPLGQTESASAVPFVGDVLQNNSIRGIPVLDQFTYQPRHAASTEGLPAVSGLPVGNGSASGLPLIGNLLGGGGGLLPF